MSISTKLRDLIHAGVQRIGQIEIQTGVHGHPYTLCHWRDAELSIELSSGGLKRYFGPSAARDQSTFAEDGSYRFSKGEENLKRGWVMILENEQDLQQALDQFYPAALGVFLAQQEGNLEIEHLRDKLNRQTGMYRYARDISDHGAQELVKQFCGPSNKCAKRILWQLDEDTPLDDSEASRFNGVPDGLTETDAIPLLCREACNHLVAECRQAAKRERQQQEAAKT